MSHDQDDLDQQLLDLIDGKEVDPSLHDRLTNDPQVRTRYLDFVALQVLLVEKLNPDTQLSPSIDEPTASTLPFPRFAAAAFALAACVAVVVLAWALWPVDRTQQIVRKDPPPRENGHRLVPSNAADPPFLGPTVDVELTANQEEVALDSTLLGDGFRATLGDRSKLPPATKVDMTLDFVWAKGGIAPPILQGGKAPAPKIGVRTVTFDIEGPGVVRKLSNVGASGPMGRRPGERLVSSHTVNALEEVRLDRSDIRIRRYVKSHVYLTEPGTYTIKARVAYAHMGHIHLATSQPVTIKVAAADKDT